MGDDTTRTAAKQTAGQWRAELARERQLQPAITRERQEKARLAFRRLRELYRAANGRPAS